MVIYVPYALSIALRNRYISVRPFDSAAGEVAYLALSMTAWLATGIWITSFLDTGNHCMDWTQGGDLWVASECDTHAALAAMGFFQFAMSAAWLGMICWIVHRSPMAPNDAFQISVNILLLSGDRFYVRKGEVDACYDPDAMQLPPLPPRPEAARFASTSAESPPYRVEDEETATPLSPYPSPSIRYLVRDHTTSNSHTRDENIDTGFTDLKSEIINPTFDRSQRKT